MVVKFKFKYKEEEVELEVKECKSFFSQAMGLMFRNRSKPLLFVFKNKKIRNIHSFFCKPFYAIWFDEDKIIDDKFVDSWIFSIGPDKRFNKLLEVPRGCKEFNFLSTDRERFK
ncbi:MAG: hypothetical protein ABIH37_02755 [archaeon]